jgi:hypothetical protein
MSTQAYVIGGISALLLLSQNKCDRPAPHYRGIAGGGGGGGGSRGSSSGGGATVVAQTSRTTTGGGTVVVTNTTPTNNQQVVDPTAPGTNRGNGAGGGGFDPPDNKLPGALDPTDPRNQRIQTNNPIVVTTGNPVVTTTTTTSTGIVENPSGFITPTLGSPSNPTSFGALPEPKLDPLPRVPNTNTTHINTYPQYPGTVTPTDPRVIKSPTLGGTASVGQAAGKLVTPSITPRKSNLAAVGTSPTTGVTGVGTSGDCTIL